MMYKQTNQKSLDQETGVKTLLGTILLILSGCILYLDKIFNYYNIGQNIEFRYYGDLEAFIWHISQTISPLLIILAYQFKPKKWALISPVSIYSIQVMYIMRDEHYIERDYFWMYTILFIIALIASYYFLELLIKAYSKKIKKLHLNIKKLCSFMYSLNTNNFIKEEKEVDFAIKRIEVADFVILDKNNDKG